MSSDDETPEVRDKLPACWRREIKELYTAIERDLGPEIPNEPKSRKALREKLFELSLMVYSVRELAYWNTRLPKLLWEVVDLVKIELAWAPWWSRELETCAKDLQLYGTSQVRLVPLK
jgi:hypothetical protein